ncbi:hypothetical protein SmJEL517_g02779 [Synchytrium microbalum]|uniref:UDP-N-acetylglucosamine diphosphorylase n=1 Tax=Synchytrium microbalum TaxID=1806994 RepID=A0A507BZP4_9FUNG|nr:uncharacterized protein SmJEL517_g02779 [Synchytrium microbalum]TPX34750.1 hypothetical protein SmJEL517_g02779 [Synchytrium microbalum]
MSSYAALKPIFDEAGQGHVFTFWDSIKDDSQKQSDLLTALSGIDPARCNRIFKNTVGGGSKDVSGGGGGIKPLPSDSVYSTITGNADEIKKWKHEGLKLISENKVGLILLAGGQGTRLGSSAPKGCYDILLPSHKSLFQLQGERIARLQKVAESTFNKPENTVIIPWYVMTSGPTRKPTESYFKEHRYFGLIPENVMFFEQGVLPAFDSTGKIFMENEYTPAVAPDGNGGIYAALRKEGVLADLSKRGIPYIHAYCVDNCLVKVADPTFMGYCVAKDAEMGCKAVPKTAPNEPVGIICIRDGKYGVVEYSEMDAALSAERDSNGGLVYQAANIANHFYTLDFLSTICSEEFEGKLDYHIARKKIKHVDLASGKMVSPDKPNGIKLEMFIFDVLPHATKVAVLQVARAEEFSPLKNAPGSPDGDSPDTSRSDIMKQHKRFLEAVGCSIVNGDEGSEDVVEISPLVSYEGEGLESFAGKSVKTPIHITSV